MNERLGHLSTDKLPLSERYRNALVRTEDYCESIGADHRFVGGTIADLLSPNTHILIDVEQRTVRLNNYPPLTAFRPDGSIKDVDVIFFTKDLEVFQTARQKFASWQETAKNNHLPFPAISAEAARHPDWPRRSNLKQFVTAWEVDSNNVPSLNFGNVRQSIDPRTIAPWTYKLENDQIELTGLNPLGFALCYVLRVPSGVKKKEKRIVECTHANNDNGMSPMTRYSKMSLAMRLAAQTHREAQRHGIDLKELHKEWVNYIYNLQHTDDLLIRLKTALTGFYWKHLGTDTAHGKGFLGLLSHFNDKMNG